MALRREIPPTGGEAYELLWYDEELDTDWTASFRLDWTGMEYVVGELRVVHKLGTPTAWDDRGLTARQIRRLHFEPALAEGRSLVEQRIAESFPSGEAGWREYVKNLGAAMAANRRGKSAKPRRHGTWSDLDLARLAAEYVAAVGRSRKPVQELADEWNYAESRIKQLMREARHRGLLTETARRRAGGQLTERARELLAGHASST